MDVFLPQSLRVLLPPLRLFKPLALLAPGAADAPFAWAGTYPGVSSHQTRKPIHKRHPHTPSKHTPGTEDLLRGLVNVGPHDRVVVVRLLDQLASFGVRHLDQTRGKTGAASTILFRSPLVRLAIDEPVHAILARSNLSLLGPGGLELCQDLLWSLSTLVHVIHRGDLLR